MMKAANLKYGLAVLALLTLFVISSCTMTNHVALNSDGSGTAEAEVEIASAFVEYLQSFSFLSPDLAYLADGIFHEDRIQQEAGTNPHVNIVKISTEKKPHPSDSSRAPSEKLTMKLTFASIDKLISHEDTLVESDILTLTQSNAGQTLSIYLDKSNFKQLYTLFPMLNNPLLEGLGPSEEPTDEQEYMDMMAGVLGNEGPGLLKASKVDLVVSVKGQLVQQTGGRVAGNTVTFSLPLLRVLLLNEALDYSLTFK